MSTPRQQQGHRVRNTVQLNAKQQAVLLWISEGCPPGVYPEDSFGHRVTARALRVRGLVSVKGHGATWTATITELGKRWLAEQFEPRKPSNVRRGAEARRSAESDTRAYEDARHRALAEAVKRMMNANAMSAPMGVNGSGQAAQTSQRLKVTVTRVQVAERWIRAADEEDAARKMQAELSKPYAYVGSWATTESEVDIEAEVVKPRAAQSSAFSMLLSFEDAAAALGVPSATLDDLITRGDIEWVRAGGLALIPRDALATFIRENTHRGDLN